MRIIYFFLIFAIIFQYSGADVPTPEQQKNIEKSFHCKLAEVEYISNEDCKPPAVRAERPSRPQSAPKTEQLSNNTMMPTHMEKRISPLFIGALISIVFFSAFMYNHKLLALGVVVAVNIIAAYFYSGMHSQPARSGYAMIMFAYFFIFSFSGYILGLATRWLFKKFK